ncbi:MAG: hypothetical protein ACRDDJ_23570, partial [[Mycobacterium] stephanolepidis]
MGCIVSWRDEPLARRASSGACKDGGVGGAPDPDQDSGPDDRIAVPAPRPAKPRLFQDGRDMFWSMAPLVVAC